MSTAELKEKIAEKLNHTDDEKALQQVLKVLSGEYIYEENIDATKHIDKLFQKHDSLLKKLS